MWYCILLNENILISVTISLKFVSKGPINNIPALVQIIAWRRPGDKSLSEPMIVYRRIYASLSLNELSDRVSSFALTHRDHSIFMMDVKSIAVNFKFQLTTTADMNNFMIKLWYLQW